MPSPGQGELFREPPASPEAGGQPASPLKGKSGGSDLAPVWLQRISLGMLVIFCFYVGGLVAVLPWSPRYWDANAWITGHPLAADWLLRGWVRGLISGLGLIDLWIGVTELLHYRDQRR